MNIKQKNAEYTLAQFVIKHKGMDAAKLNPLERRVVSSFLTDLEKALDVIEQEVVSKLL
ncbi:hypothetical protein [Ureibacillus endophyticus]|uniref:hypothetical protein n=1 Tax=Ureibacillus endophyticus TaxID=1978490 RepID=UPI00147373E5|nr:hypothetical protein [Lysinibacillus endophyticus]